MTKWPPLPIVDRDDQLIGEAMLEDIHREGLIHRIVYTLVENAKGQLLLQKRSAAMSIFPNCWDISSAGHVDLGEDYLTAARRELQEEVGLSGHSLEQIDYFYSDRSYENVKLNRFITVYRVVVPDDAKVIFAPEEISAVRWVSTEEARELVQRHPDQVAVALSECLDKYYPQ